jgi:hypothetical protein
MLLVFSLILAKIIGKRIEDGITINPLTPTPLPRTQGRGASRQAIFREWYAVEDAGACQRQARTIIVYEILTPNPSPFHGRGEQNHFI